MHIYDWCGGAIINNCTSLPFLYAGRNGRAYVCFFGGCLLHEVYAKKVIGKYIKYASLVLIVSFILWWVNKGSIILLLSTVQFGEFDFVVTVLVIPLIIAIALDNNIVSRILSMRGVKVLGDVSSTLYMTHWVVISFFFILVEQFPALTSIPCICMVIISLVSAVCFAYLWNKAENYCRKLRKKR